MATSLAELLFNNYRRRVLGLLLLRPDEAYHVREIARLTNTQAGTLHKELSRLAQAGLLLKSTQGNQVSYQANRDSIIFEELASILRKTSGMVEVLVNHLDPIRHNISLAAIFGSIASAKATNTSDIDLLVLGNVSYPNLVKALYPAQALLQRDINPKLFSIDEWQRLVTSNSVFVQELKEKPLLEVIGKKDELWSSTT